MTSGERERERKAIMEHACPRCGSPRLNRCRSLLKNRAILEYSHRERLRLVKKVRSKMAPLDAASIMGYVRVFNGCWLWTGKLNNSGYGRYGIKFSHRLSYEIFKGPIPKGMHVDHLCFSPSCIRPEHLQIAEPTVNRKRNLKALAKECRRGHPFTPENTILKKNGSRIQRLCRTCSNTGQRTRHRARRVKASPEAAGTETTDGA